MRPTPRWLLAASLEAVVTPALAHDLAMFRGNPRHTGVYDVSGAPVLHGVKWQFHTGDGTPNYEAAFSDSFYDDLIIGQSRMTSLGPIRSSPVVADGEVYFGGSDGSVYALT